MFLYTVAKEMLGMSGRTDSKTQLWSRISAQLTQLPGTSSIAGALRRDVRAYKGAETPQIRHFCS